MNEEELLIALNNEEKKIEKELERLEKELEKVKEIGEAYGKREWIKVEIENTKDKYRRIKGKIDEVKKLSKLVTTYKKSSTIKAWIESLIKHIIEKEPLGKEVEYKLHGETGVEITIKYPAGPVIQHAYVEDKIMISNPEEQMRLYVETRVRKEGKQKEDVYQSTKLYDSEGLLISHQLSTPEKQVEAAIIDGQVVYSHKSAHAGEDGTENGVYISDEKEFFQKETVFSSDGLDYGRRGRQISTEPVKILNLKGMPLEEIKKLIKLQQEQDYGRGR